MKIPMNKMRGWLVAILVLVMAAICQYGAMAQITNVPAAPPVPTEKPPTTPQDILTTTMNYFGSHNPDLAGAFLNRKGEIWTGADYQNQINISSCVGIEYNVLNFSKATNTAHYLALESVTRNAGIAGTIVSEQLDAKFKVVVQGDLEIGFLLGGGYTLNPEKHPIFVAGADLKKALTQNTWAGLRLEDQFAKGGKSKPVISVLAGINF